MTAAPQAIPWGPPSLTSQILPQPSSWSGWDEPPPRKRRTRPVPFPVNCVMPWVIVGHFYDIGSGRKDLDARGRSLAHERFHTPIPRDGGVADLLEEVTVEEELEQRGVALCAADELAMAVTDFAPPRTATRHSASKEPIRYRQP
nr:hypothetical protein [Streptomyces gossypii]